MLITTAARLPNAGATTFFPGRTFFFRKTPMNGNSVIRITSRSIQMLFAKRMLNRYPRLPKNDVLTCPRISIKRNEGTMSTKMVISAVVRQLPSFFRFCFDPCSRALRSAIKALSRFAMELSCML